MMRRANGVVVVLVGREPTGCAVERFLYSYLFFSVYIFFIFFYGSGYSCKSIDTIHVKLLLAHFTSARLDPPSISNVNVQFLSI
jgi:hypothetical protein